MQTFIVANATDKAEYLRTHFDLPEGTPVVARADADFVSSLPPGATVIGQIPLEALFAYPHRKLNYVYVKMARVKQDAQQKPDATQHFTIRLPEELPFELFVYPLQLIAGSLRLA